MADVFLSYAREDQDRARAIAGALEARRWSVFWDRKLLGGQEFRPVLERELQSARCVVVLWSERSLASPFVRDEAAEALNGRLVPVLIDPVLPPLGFREIQHVDLSRWHGDPADDDFLRFASAVQAIAPADGGPLPHPETGGQSRLRQIPGARILALATVGVLVLASIASFLVRLPADVDLDIEARAVSFRMNGADNVALFTGLRLDRLTMQNLDVVKSLSNVFATVADPSRKAAVTADHVGDFTLNVPRQTAVQFSASPDEPGAVKVVFTKGPASAIFTAGGVLAARCPGCAESDAALLASLVGKPASLQVHGDPARTTALLVSAAPLTAATLDVDSIGFDELVDDRFVSTVLAGTITFRNGGLASETLKKDASLTLRDLSGATLTLSGDRNLRLRLVARAGRISISEGGLSRDLRPTAFAVLTRYPAVIGASAVVLVMFVSLLARPPARWRRLR